MVHVTLVTICIFATSYQIFAQTASSSASPSSILNSVANTPKDRGMDVTLSPVFLNLAASAGKSAKSSIKITNNNPFAEAYVLTVIRFRPDASGQSIIPVDTDPNDERLQWITLGEKYIVIDSGSTKKIEFEVKTPEYAFLGYYFGISVKRVKEHFGPNDTTKVVGQAVMPILLEVTRTDKQGKLFVDSGKDVYKQGQIADFTTSSWWYEYLPAEFEVKFKNTGRVHLSPFGNIILQQGEEEVGSIQVNELGGNTLPGSTRSYKSIWNDGFIIREPVKENGVYKMNKNGKMVYKTVIHWDALTKIRIGKYVAKAIVVYDNGRNDVPLEASLSFWVFPWKIILGVLLVVSLVMFGIKNAIFSLFGR